MQNAVRTAGIAPGRVEGDEAIPACEIGKRIDLFHLCLSARRKHTKLPLYFRRGKIQHFPRAIHAQLRGVLNNFRRLSAYIPAILRIYRSAREKKPAWDSASAQILTMSSSVPPSSRNLPISSPAMLRVISG